MKTLGHLSPRATPLAVAVSLVLFAGGTYAAGPAGGGLAGSTTGAAGGPVAAGVSGAGHSGAGRGGGSMGPAISGARPGVSFSNNNAGQHLGNGSFARSGGVRGAGTVPSGLSLPYRNVPNAFVAPGAATARATNAPSVARPANSWSGTAVASTNNSNNLAATRGAVRPRGRGNNNWTANGFTGQRLDASAPGANLPSYNQGDHGNRGNRNGNYRYRFPGRYYYYPYAHGPYYAPYVSYFGGYYGGAYPYYNDVPFADTSYENSAAATVAPQYSEQAPANPDGDQPGAAQEPQQSAPQRQQQPDASNGGGTIPNNGPDSLVEAVQEELARRGYYGGKVDSMFNPDTKEALRKFQADHHLATTGLVNEATLHALQLD